MIQVPGGQAPGVTQPADFPITLPPGTRVTLRPVCSRCQQAIEAEAEQDEAAA